jgi:cell division protein ZapA (FtsZ GTPase activity inhibitor)
MDKTTHRLKIAGEEYRIVSTESAQYMDELAHEIDIKMANMLKGNRVSTTQAAVLVALQYADDARKNGGTSDALRTQIKECLEDSAKAKSERDFYKREYERLKAVAEAGEAPQGSLWR